MEVYPVPPSDFCKRLYELDPNLSLNWDPSHGVWAIWFNDPNKRTREHVMNVVEADGSYRPLDGRTLQAVQMNRWYAEHPQELLDVLIDEPARRLEAAAKSDRDNALHFAKDKALKRRFDETVEKAKSIPWEQWATPTTFRAANGETLTWMPHQSLRFQKKPSDLDADEIIKQGTDQ